jgi:hypothetical protein
MSSLNQLNREAEYRGYGKIKEILHTVPILYAGWEADNVAWIVRMEDGTIKGFHTSHGGLYPWDVQEMEDKLKETEDSAAQLRAAIATLRLSEKVNL